MKVILLAGGRGTRLSDYTNIMPKPMVRIGGKPFAPTYNRIVFKI